MNTADTALRIQEVDRTLAARQGQLDALTAQLEAKKARAEALTEAQHSLEEAMAVLTSFGENRQKDVQRKVETLVTYGLQTVFGEDMSFHIEQGAHGSNATVSFTIRSLLGDKIVETPVMDARGGGVAVVVGLLLRLLMISLRGDAAPVLILDESFAQVSSEYEEGVAELLKAVTAQAGVQVIMVTHSDAYNEVADTVYRFDQRAGATVVREETKR